MKLFKKLLIANRGEIAVRVIKSAKKLGIETVAIYSEPDEDSLHVKLADEAFCIGPQELGESYLNIEKIIQTAVNFNCDAIHPGYGFLSENADFVKACENAGITFIGPHAEVMKIMGNKIEARKFVKKLGVPITEGITGTTAELLKNVDKLEFPVLVKAAAGGGGKGMRIVYNRDELEGVLETTSREAKNYFGDETVYIEKYIPEPRHIEVQILGDNHGNVIHLFERECSIQRRYQKIIEESPSPTLTDELREKMGNAAVEIGKAIGYNNAGTIEFLVDKDLNFYFLEMNTRIQVEHPVTEMVTDIDIVEEQLMVAAGNRLKYNQKDIKQNGHAIECRIYAEDPSNNFMPSPGKMTLYRQPQGEDIRIDTAIDKATEIQSFFDPMISKLIVKGENREIAIEKSIDALKNYDIHGIKTNIPYLLQLLNHPDFVNNKISTKFCDEHTGEIIKNIETEKNKIDKKIPVFGYLLYTLYSYGDNETDVWHNIGYWRNIMKIPVTLENVKYEILINKKRENTLNVVFENENYELCFKEFDNGRLKFRINDTFYNVSVSENEERFGFVSVDGFIFNVERNDILKNIDYSLTSGDNNDKNSLFSPMPGKVIKVNVKKGDKVKNGTVLVVVEAMKMENNIVATGDATVEEVAVKEGDMVDTNMQLVYLTE